MSGLFDLFRKKNNCSDSTGIHEFCTNCGANLRLQRGFSNDLPCWECRGCGMMLINPDVEAENDIVWICDGCGAVLNVQTGFSEDTGEWKCTECGHGNSIDIREIYNSEDEYRMEQENPYKGLSDDDALELSLYSERVKIDGRENVILVEHKETKKEYIKKILTIYDRSIYEYLKENPIEHMPRIIAIFESDNALIVIEEYILGVSPLSLFQSGDLNEKRAITITRNTCAIIRDLHNLPTPIIHRDIKPANILLTGYDEVCLLDMNTAKWYEPDKTDDTRYLGTQGYAAPEQVGYGLTASSTKTDIYSLGVLLNELLTGGHPKEKRATGKAWDIIERCIRLEASERYTVDELISELDNLLENSYAE